MTIGDVKPFFLRTPVKSLGEIGTEIVRIEGIDFQVRRPTKSDLLLNDPTVQKANEVDDYMPYWADIWPASRMMAKAILRMPEDEWPAGAEVLELGCGLGVAGLAALHRGRRVVFSDYDLTALEFAAQNAKWNGFSDYETLPLDWRVPPTDRKFQVILAADLIYEAVKHGPLLTLLRHMLAPDGVAWFTDPDRISSEAFRQQLPSCGFEYRHEFMRVGEPGGHRSKGTIYKLKWPDPKASVET